MPISVYPELSAVYVLLAADGSRAVFNNPSDPDYVGPLVDHSGFDSPEVREEAENRPVQDGGLNGEFWYGRRPVTLTGKLLNPVNAVERGNRADKLSRAVKGCLRTDGILSWTLSNGQQVYAAVRCQSPFRLTGAWQKEFLIGMVAEDPRFYSTSQQTTTQDGGVSAYMDLLTTNGISITNGVAGSGTSFPLRFPVSFALSPYNPTAARPLRTSFARVIATNNGNADSPPVLKVEGTQIGSVGSGLGMILRNSTTGKSMLIQPPGFGTGVTPLIVDMARAKIMIDGTDAYQWLLPAVSDWWALAPGPNLIELVVGYASNDVKLTVSWQDAWV